SEPRGYDSLVGALLCPPADPARTAAVIFFDNAGYLPMSGHGVIGLMATLEYLGQIKPSGVHRIETPAGTVSAEVHPGGDISVQNVASYRYKKNITVNSNDFGAVTGDVAWGGNWFFVVDDAGQDLNLARAEKLTEEGREIIEALDRDRVRGRNGETITNVAFFGPPHRRDANSRNFVLRSGRAYGRSPCGTGTSARLACLYEDGKLAEGQNWRQESIVGTVFDGSVSVIDGVIRPTIRGNAFITAESMLIVDERDPLCWGLT
ncbi:MAG TPA: proline racemase family protein, partial [Thermoanaerobaculia bacterium]|nr:proline racemase family protein [Thermoanaerobaculia bacterium]